MPHGSVLFSAYVANAHQALNGNGVLIPQAKIYFWGKMKQTGFIALPMMGWAAIAAGVVIAGLGIALKIQSARLETSKAETVAVQGKFDAFVSQAKALG